MKRTLTILALVCVLACPSLNAQTAFRALTAAEYKKAKTLTVKDLESDTYVKFENAYVLDRYEMKPPYVFKYSDGIERRVYLYRLLDNKTKEAMAMVAVYTVPSKKQVFNVCVPSPVSDKAVWATYIDDLKEYNKQEPAFGSAFAYVMSREMIGLSGGTVGSAQANKSDYDVCFPAYAPVTLPDGSVQPIAAIRPGDQVAGYNAKTGRPESVLVKKVEIHAGQVYELTTLTLGSETITAGKNTRQLAQVTTLQATPNHPVLTPQGEKTAGTLQTGDQVLVHNAETNRFETFRVVSSDTRSATDKVYNLVTDSGNYLIGGAVVMDKK